MPNSSSASAAAAINDQSESDPITTPTNGCSATVPPHFPRPGRAVTVSEPRLPGSGPLRRERSDRGRAYRPLGCSGDDRSTRDPHRGPPLAEARRRAGPFRLGRCPVSYTHLTLPTIYSV